MNKTKKCFKCGIIKRLDSFYKHPDMPDGHVNKCKSCNKKDVAENYRKNIDYYINYEKERFKRPERKEQIKKYQQKRRDAYRGKNIARNKISNYIRDGKLVRLPCEVCGEIKSQAHHQDYRSPLKVKWLYIKHHLELHNKISYGK
jgi:hypothetical protein